jgi:hypothetical protein
VHTLAEWKAAVAGRCGVNGVVAVAVCGHGGQKMAAGCANAELGEGAYRVTVAYAETVEAHA